MQNIRSVKLKTKSAKLQRKREKTVVLSFKLLFFAFSFTFFAFLLPQTANAGFIVKAPPYIGLNEGLVGFWSFNGPDMSQSTNNVWALDRSGQGNNGVLKNMATSTARKIGKLGQALEFDGVNDYVDVGSDTTLDNISIMTISAWINPRSAGEGTSGTIVGKILGGTQGFQFYVCSNHNGECPSTTNTITFFKPDGFNNIAWDVDTANTIKMNTWQHVVLIYDNSSFSNDPIFYVNGI